jgi:hypothetical protein
MQARQLDSLIFCTSGRDLLKPPDRKSGACSNSFAGFLFAFSSTPLQPSNTWLGKNEFAAN